jgi:hypothetical protein
MQRPDYPSDEDNRQAHREQHDLETWHAFPGRIQSYDPATQTATIVPLLRVQVPHPSGEYTYEEAPPVPHVAIIQPRVRGWFFSLPVQDGDTVMCVCADGDVGTWRRGSGDVTSPRDLRRHHLAHAVAFVGLYTFNQPLAHVPPSLADAGPELPAMVFGSDADDGTRVAFKVNGAVEITRGTDVVLRIDPDRTVHLGSNVGSFVALAPLVDAIVSSLKSAVAAWTPVPGDGGASLKTVIAAWSPSSTAATKAKAT